jgi:uncharacterized protein YndB with AHSA1/START domain
MTAQATGHLIRHLGRDGIRFERTFRAPTTDVWAAVTESDRMARWIGTWTGDPASGTVQLYMNAEGDDVEPSTVHIDRCEPPQLLAVRTVDNFGSWTLTVELAETGGVTTLSLVQVVDDPSMIESTGPGWDYYLDRLVAAETGGDPAAIDWDRDYYPAMKDHYLALTAQLTG